MKLSFLLPFINYLSVCLCQIKFKYVNFLSIMYQAKFSSLFKKDPLWYNCQEFRKILIKKSTCSMFVIEFFLRKIKFHVIYIIITLINKMKIICKYSFFFFIKMCIMISSELWNLFFRNQICTRVEVLTSLLVASNDLQIIKNLNLV